MRSVLFLILFSFIPFKTTNANKSVELEKNDHTIDVRGASPRKDPRKRDRRERKLQFSLPPLTSQQPTGTNAPSQAPTKKPSANNVGVIVRFRSRNGVMSAMNDASVSIMMQDDNLEILGMEMSPQRVKDYKKDKFVTSVDIDHVTKPFVHKKRSFDGARDLLEKTPWGIPTVLQDVDFWDKSVPDGAIKICVTDTGYDIDHPDLPSKIGDDVVGRDGMGESWKIDTYSHGAHCAGTIAAKGNNNEGVVGVIPNTKDGKFQLVITKSLNKNGAGTVSSTIKSIQACLDLGATVISISSGCDNCKSQTEEGFFNDIYKKGVLSISAAGNNGNKARSYPASYKTVISVAAIDQKLKQASFSQFNHQVELSAPGVGIKSTTPKGYEIWDGTSMATPHVAAVTGLVWMHFPKCKHYEIRNVLAQSAKTLGTNLCDKKFGHGLIQAKAAYDILAKGNCGKGIGTKDAIGGCEQLYADGFQTSSSPTKKPIEKKPPKNKKAKPSKNKEKKPSKNKKTKPSKNKKKKPPTMGKPNKKPPKKKKGKLNKKPPRKKKGKLNKKPPRKKKGKPNKKPPRKKKDKLKKNKKDKPNNKPPKKKKDEPEKKKEKPKTNKPKKKKPKPKTTTSFSPTGTYNPTATWSVISTSSQTSNADGEELFPPIPCDSGRVPIKIELQTDRYPEDNGYVVKEDTGNTLVNINKGTYSDANKVYTEEGCVYPGCFTFTIVDDYGDGICCDWGNGFYALTYDNEPSTIGGNRFDETETIEFGECD